MFKKLKALLIVIGLGALCGGISACATVPKTDEYRDQGYKISVTYNANGGKFMQLNGISVVDMFNPDDYSAAADGKIHIKLREPTDRNRPTASNSNIVITNQGYFLAGWYKQRELKTNDEKEPVDENGEVLIELDGYYYYPPAQNAAGNPVDENGYELVVKDNGHYFYSPDSGIELKEDEEEREYQLEPANAVFEYDGRWDFSSDEVVYSEEDDELNITLYAAWVPDYKYEYYAKNAAGEWELYSTSTFTGEALEEVNSNVNLKTIWTPRWQTGEDGDDGKINQSHRYDGAIYTFPAVTGKTFKKAYSDPNCLNEIGSSFVHQGTLDLVHAKAVNRVQKIYVETYDEMRFKISDAEQLAGCVTDEMNENAEIGVNGYKGYYEILNDLSFAETAWPSGLTTGEFGGKMFSSNGSEITFSDISVRYNSENAYYGGVFGCLTETAEISDITFENVTFDLFYIGTRRFGELYYGFFAGLVEEGAKLTNTKIAGNAEFKIGSVIVNEEDMYFNIISNGDGVKIATENKVKFTVYGTDMGYTDGSGNELYRYTIEFNTDNDENPTTPKINIDGSGNITLKPVTQVMTTAPSYDIDYQEANNE